MVALAGNYDPAQVKALIDEHFGAWENRGERIEVPAMQVLSGQTRVKEKDTEQLHLCLGYPGTAYGSEGIYPQAVLNNLLGGAMSSRLFQRIREELGMAYSIYTYPNSYLGCGAFAVYAGVSPKNGQQVLDEIRREMRKLLDEGISEKEFREAKTQLRGGYLLGLESPGGRMNSMGRSLLLLGKTAMPENTIRLIESVTLDDVTATAQHILSAEPCLAAAGKGTKQFQ